MAKLLRVDEMLEPPMVGQTYLVPTINYRFGDDKKHRNYPIMGTLHEDAEHIGFPWMHYHMDWRFAPQSAIRYAKRRGHWFAGEQAVFGIPLQNRDYPHGDVTYRRLKCRRAPPINTIFSKPKPSGYPSNGQLLHRAWFGKPAARGPHGLICPHRGTVLGSALVETDGSITCPLHGLKFCAKTGASIATHDMSAA